MPFGYCALHGLTGAIPSVRPDRLRGATPFLGNGQLWGTARAKKAITLRRIGIQSLMSDVCTVVISVSRNLASARFARPQMPAGMERKKSGLQTKSIITSHKRRHHVQAICLRKIALAAIVSVLASQAVLAVTPTMQSESATLSGASNQVVITRVPITNQFGVVKYWDIQFQFTLDPLTGKPSVSTGFPTVVTSPSITVGNFKPGTYIDSKGRKYTVGGPNVAAGGRTSWSLAAVPSASGLSVSVGWTTGPIVGHPNQASLNARAITSTAFSWGTMGSSNDTASTNNPFYPSFWTAGSVSATSRSQRASWQGVLWNPHQHRVALG